jgi:hypothetical protein
VQAEVLRQQRTVTDERRDWALEKRVQAPSLTFLPRSDPKQMVFEAETIRKGPATDRYLATPEPRESSVEPMRPRQILYPAQDYNLRLLHLLQLLH